MTSQLIIKGLKVAGVALTTAILGVVVQKATEDTMDAVVDDCIDFYDDNFFVEEEQKSGLFRKKKTVRRNRFTGKIKEEN